MDEIMLNSKFMKWFICKMIKKSIRKKYGADVEIQLNTFEYRADDNEANIHIDARLKANRADFNKILTSIGDK